VRSVAHAPVAVIAAWSPAAVSLAVLALLGVAAAVWWSVGPARERSEPLLHPEGAPPARPRIRRPIEPWVVVAVALMVAGIVVAPRLLGFTFLFLPLVFGHRRREPGPGGGRGRPRGEHDSPS
jgi:hypothetical protein